MFMALQTVQNNALTYQVAPHIAAPHCFTTRLGGVSTGYLSSMNIGTHRGDTPENVLKNYQILADTLQFDVQKLVLTKQTHTDTVRQVGQNEWGAGLFQPELSPCDALITNTPGTALVVFTADCTPILLHDPVTGAVGAVHAGWRGTAADIAGKAVRAMVTAYGCLPENIRAAIGPNIAQCCFATDSDVPQAMVSSFGQGVLDCIRSQGNKYYVNLKEVNARALLRAGVTEIAVSEHCTACASDLFWSHRINGPLRGSQGAIIVCKEESL